jgi:hypothetical protein
VTSIRITGAPGKPTAIHQVVIEHQRRDLAASVMTGAQFARQNVKRKGGVLWLACESQTEIPKRLEAAWKERGGSGRAPFFWTKAAPALLGDHAEEILTQMAQQAAKLMQERFNRKRPLFPTYIMGG